MVVVSSFRLRVDGGVVKVSVTTPSYDEAASWVVTKKRELVPTAIDLSPQRESVAQIIGCDQRVCSKSVLCEGSGVSISKNNAAGIWALVHPHSASAGSEYASGRCT